jgi:hypothetical protein
MQIEAPSPEVTQPSAGRAVVRGVVFFFLGLAGSAVALLVSVVRVAPDDKLLWEFLYDVPACAAGALFGGALGVVASMFGRPAVRWAFLLLSFLSAPAEIALWHLLLDHVR